MMSPEEQACRAIMEWSAPPSVDRSAKLVAAIKIETRTLLITGEPERKGRRRDDMAQLRCELIECWPDIRNGRVSAEEIDELGFYTIVSRQAGTLATLITARKARV
jgi:hypothetical protein